MRANNIAKLSALLSIATVHAQVVSANNCTVFSWDQQPAYYVYGPPERISGASTCAPRNNESHYCALNADGDIQVQYSKNVTSLRDSCWNTPDGPACFLESIVKTAVNASLNGEPWNNSVIASVNTWEAIEPGTSAYLNFTTLKRCFVGTMSNCTGNLTDGVVLEACAPVYHTTGTNPRAIMDGEVIVVNVSEADVGNFRDPFEKQFSGEGGGAAGNFVVGGNVLAVAVAVTFATALL
ncbi:hypothetical protein ONS95_014468 [Cadophora gregata]|uniref:uncharacterized protein n=1 Tax=Cadophora gregata TaxID=51156 RepID=UPI0026DBEAE4|nr:uncharacterized protein ONS95_014468 [Cadophora gregata]KAK0112732.1 hypothetical protein ONS95_014468 [Cadophora gregata]KAK0124867.1 hypothetical protein ONS96_008746 [Cadophora gregata f. sp. sojae]